MKFTLISTTDFSFQGILTNIFATVAFLLDDSDADAAWNCVRSLPSTDDSYFASVQAYLDGVSNPNMDDFLEALVMDIADALNVFKDRVEVEVPRGIPGDDGGADSNDSGNGSPVNINLIDIVENEAIPSNEEFADILSTSPLTFSNRVRSAEDKSTSIFRLFVEQVPDVSSSTSVMRISNIALAFSATALAVFMM